MMMPTWVFVIGGAAAIALVAATVFIFARSGK
jgi:hypothetical protein